MSFSCPDERSNRLRQVELLCHNLSGLHQQRDRIIGQRIGPAELRWRPLGLHALGGKTVCSTYAPKVPMLVGSGITTILCLLFRRVRCQRSRRSSSQLPPYP